MVACRNVDPEETATLANPFNVRKLTTDRHDGSELRSHHGNDEQDRTEQCQAPYRFGPEVWWRGCAVDAAHHAFTGLGWPTACQ